MHKLIEQIAAAVARAEAREPELQALRSLRDVLIRDLHMTDVRAPGEIVIRVAQLQENLEHALRQRAAQCARIDDLTDQLAQALVRMNAAERERDDYQAHYESVLAKNDACAEQWKEFHARAEAVERERDAALTFHRESVAGRKEAERKLAELTEAARGACWANYPRRPEGVDVLEALLDRQQREAAPAARLKYAYYHECGADPGEWEAHKDGCPKADRQHT
jgi:chromosome segregation ATPase